MNTDTELMIVLTPTQALGVALSIPAGTMTMGDCQEAAPEMLAHLNAMGFDVVPTVRLATAEARSTALEGALEQAAYAIHGESCASGWNDEHDCAASAYRALLAAPEEEPR